MEDIRVQDRLSRANPAVNDNIRREVRGKYVASRRGEPLREQVLRRGVSEHVPRRDCPIEALLELERRGGPRVLRGEGELAVRPREQPHREVEEVQRVLDLGHRVDEVGVDGGDKRLHLGGREVRLGGAPYPPLRGRRDGAGRGGPGRRGRGVDAHQEVGGLHGGRRQRPVVVVVELLLVVPAVPGVIRDVIGAFRVLGVGVVVLVRHYNVARPGRQRRRTDGGGPDRRDAGPPRAPGVRRGHEGQRGLGGAGRGQTGGGLALVMGLDAGGGRVGDLGLVDVEDKIAGLLGSHLGE